MTQTSKNQPRRKKNRETVVMTRLARIFMNPTWRCINTTILGQGQRSTCPASSRPYYVRRCPAPFASLFSSPRTTNELNRATVKEQLVCTLINEWKPASKKHRYKCHAGAERLAGVPRRKRYGHVGRTGRLSSFASVLVREELGAQSTALPLPHSLPVRRGLAA